jgi:amino acid adenylation domain-containing protein/thioester reductase-like protein
MTVNESADSSMFGRVVAYPADRMVPELIADQEIKHPDQVALVSGQSYLTYRQLRVLAADMSRKVLASGVGRGEFVPLLMDNGPEIPVSMLGLMRIGVPFVPLDRQWPSDRLRAVLSELAPRTVLYTGSPVRQVPGVSWQEVRLGETVAQDPETALGDPPRAEELAYGFYTSGSTGRPKCALNHHAGLLNRFQFMSRAFGSGPDQVVLQNSRCTFDPSLWQFLWPLTTGSRVVIPPPTDGLDLLTTVETIARHQVTMTDMVCSVFNILVELLESDPRLVKSLSSLRRLMIGGEAVNPAAVHAFRALMPDVAVINGYGVTEASIASVFHEVTDADGHNIPIGRPIDNTFAAILDDQRRPVGPGETGEIYLGGVCLGAGYLKDPERTRAAFVPNPFPWIPGERLYRTGDLGYADDGCLYFAGRRDEQVKIGGVRIELAEVEQVILDQREVREAKVVVAEQGGSRTLVAFVTGDTASADQLALALSASLPAEYVPKRFVVLDRLPLLANGKTDLRALARLAARQGESPEEVVPPADTVERAVRTAWQQTLCGPPPGPDDDFFTLGGDSLTAHRLATALQTALGVPFTVRDVIQAPTPAAQAARARGHVVEGDASAALRAEVRLPDEIAASPETDSHRAPPRHLLVTGVTGFVGAQLAHDLLRRTDATLHCLVRATDPVSARRRLMENLQRYRLWTPEAADRLVAVPADIARPLLGLSEAVYHRLATEVDGVVHAAAMVNFVLPYASHRADNVVGTVEILRFAVAQGRTKPVHFVSTLGVLPPDEGPRLAEGPLPQVLPKSGYSQSKWVSEELVRIAGERGLPVAIYRLGEVTPHSVHGVPNPRALLDLLVRACLRIGRCPSELITFDYTPVDYVGSVVAECVTGHRRGWYHLAGQRAVTLDELLSAFGQITLERVSYPKFWRSLTDAYAKAPQDQTLGGLLAALPVPGPSGDGDPLAGLFLSAADGYRCERARRVDAAAGWDGPIADTAVLSRYAAYHSNEG